jgi:ABC-type sugar transport system ATPase subunit
VVPSQPILEIEHLSKTFLGTRALVDVALTIEPQEVHALVGTNGSGKSTLIKVLAGYHEADPGGRAWLNGEELPLDASGSGQSSQLRFVHQDLGLVSELSIMDNLALTRGYPLTRFGGIDWRQQRRATDEMLGRFGVELDVEQTVGAISPVERVIVAIARALEDWEDGPCLLVLDEPTAVLPPAEVGRLFDLVQGVRDRGASVLYVSHRLDEIFRISDRVTVLRGGEKVLTQATAELDSRALARAMVGEEVDSDYRAGVEADENADIVLEGRQLRGRFLKDVAFELRRGEILGIAGLAGSGREELPYLISAKLEGQAFSGELRMAAQGSAWRQASNADHLGIPLVPADRAGEAIFAEMSVRENLTIRILDRMGKLRLDSHRDTASALEWSHRMNVNMPSLDAPVTWLSGGNQQKIVVGRCLSVESPVIVLSEPTAGVDIGSRVALYEFLAAEARQGLSVIVASSDIGDLLAMCSRVITLKEGRCVAEIDRRDLTESTLLQAMETGTWS